MSKQDLRLDALKASSLMNEVALHGVFCQLFHQPNASGADPARVGHVDVGVALESLASQITHGRAITVLFPRSFSGICSGEKIGSQSINLALENALRSLNVYRLQIEVSSIEARCADIEVAMPFSS